MLVRSGFEMIAGAAGIYLVIFGSSRSDTVDVVTGACECDDSFYRQPEEGCKHVRRVEFATGRREIPAWVETEAVDDRLGRYVDSAERSRR